MKKICLAVVILNLMIILSACVGGQETFEIKKYLSRNYGSEEFTIKKNKQSSPTSYEVFMNEVPEIPFTLTIDDSGTFHDDYAEQVLQGQMDRLGLSWERTEDYKIRIYYKGYEAIDEVVEKVAEFIKISEQTQAFNPIDEICLLILLPEAAPDPWFPGYQVRLRDDGYAVFASYKGPDDRFYAEAKRMNLEKLAEEVRLCHIYNQYQFTINPDVTGATEEDMERYYQFSSGVTGKADDGTETIYAEADMPGSNFMFGSAYQILAAEGLITDVGDNRFTAEANGRSVEFTISFTPEGPIGDSSVIGEEAAVAEQEEAVGGQEEDPLYQAMHEFYNQDLMTEVKALTGKWFSDTTPEKIASGKEEERLARLPDIEVCFDNATPVGDAAVVHNSQFTVLSAQLVPSIEQGTLSYQPPAGRTCMLLRIKVENTGTEPANLFKWTLFTENDYSGVISDRQANLYEPLDVIGLDYDDIYTTLEPGESAEGNVLFSIPEELAAVPDELVFIIFNVRREHVGFQLPERMGS